MVLVVQVMFGGLGVVLIPNKLAANVNKAQIVAAQHALRELGVHVDGNCSAHSDDDDDDDENFCCCSCFSSCNPNRSINQCRIICSGPSSRGLSNLGPLKC